MRYLALLYLSISLTTLHAQPSWHHGRLKVTQDGHSLQYEDGTPFFWLGDTGWELFHRLTLPEIRTYLDDRAAKGFNVIQAVALAEFDGLRRPNRYGQRPLDKLDPTHPNEAYFRVIDSTMRMALHRGLFIGLLPTWGDKVTKMWGEGPVIFDSVNAYTYGKWIGHRYRDFPNIIWILGGDRPAVKDSMDWRPIWRQMARGIIEGTDHRCIIAYHPWGGPNSTSQWIHQEAWLDINMFQSGHGAGHDTECWELAARDHALLPAKPTLDAEPNYEDHPVNPWPKWNTDSGYFRDYDVRKQLYRSVFAGGCGVTYGHHAIWQFMNEREETLNYPDRGWLNALNRPGARQAGYLRKLMGSRPTGLRVRDTSLVIGGLGTKGQHMEAFRTADNSCVMVYCPVRRKIIVDATTIKDEKIDAWKFSAKEGTFEWIGTSDKGARMEFDPPSRDKGEDWVLVLDAHSKHYSQPGR